MGCNSSKSTGANEDNKPFTNIEDGNKAQAEDNGGGNSGAKGRYASNGKSSSSAAAAASASSSSAVNNLSSPLHTDIVFSLCSGPLTSTPSFFSGSEDRSVSWFDASGAKTQFAKAHDRAVSDLVFSTHTSSLFTASRDKFLHQWTVPASSSSSSSSPASLSRLQTFKGHSLPISCVDVNREDGQQIVSGGRDYQLRFWDVNTATCLFWTEIQQNVITDVKYLNGEAAVLQASEDLSLRVWDIRSRGEAQRFDDGPYFAMCADVSADNNYFFTGHNGFESVGCELKMFDRRMGKKIMEVQAGSQAVWSAALLKGDAVKNKLMAVSTSKDGLLRVWDLDRIIGMGSDVALSDRVVSEGIVAEEQFDMGEAAQSMAVAPVPADGWNQVSLATGHMNGRVSLWSLDVNKKSLTLKMNAPGAVEQ